MICCLAIQSQNALQINLKYKEEDSSFPIQTQAKVHGEHWVTFYFPKRGPFEFFDTREHMLEDYLYGVGFEKILKRKYLKNVGQLQQSTSNVCGLYCANYVMKKYQGKTKDIVKDLNVQEKKRNDRLIVTKMMKLCTRKRPVHRKLCTIYVVLVLGSILQ